MEFNKIRNYLDRINSDKKIREITLKKLLSITSILLFCFLTPSIFGQEYEVPHNYKFQTHEDYKNYEAQILKAIEFLESTPFDENIQKRKEVNKFIILWLTGCPNVKITLRSFLMDYCKENADFMIIFMGGWARYTLENNGDNDEFKGSLAGIHSIIKVYNLGKGINEDDNVEELIELENEGNLEKWLKEEIQNSIENEKS